MDNDFQLKTKIAAAVGFASGIYYQGLFAGGIVVSYGPFAGHPLTTSFTSKIAALVVTGLITGKATHRLLQHLDTQRWKWTKETVAVEADWYVMPPTPTFENEFSWILGEVHNGHAFDYRTFGTAGEAVMEVGDAELKGQYSKDPDWFVIPAKAMYTGICMLGATGASKTAGGARPLLRQYLGWAKNKLALKGMALIGDCKGSLVEPTIATAKEAGREKDLFVIGPAHDVPWNPVYAPELAPNAIVPRIMAAMEAMGGPPSDDSKWIFDNNSRLFEGAIGLLRQTKVEGYFTLVDMDNLIKHVRAARLTIAEGSGGSPETAVKESLVSFATAAKDLGRFKQAEWDYYSSRISAVMSNPERHLGTILNQTDCILGFWSDPAIVDKYCPPKADLLARGFRGFEWALQEGRIVVMDCPQSVHGEVAKAIAVFLKLAFQRCMLNRPTRWRTNPNENKNRPALLLLDEYQEFVTTSGNEGDDQFFALSRESKTICVVFTQSRSSIEKQIGAIKTENVLANLRTKIIQTQAEPKDREYAASVCGKTWGELENSTIGGTAEKARLSGSGVFMGDSTSVSESISLNRQELFDFDPTFFRNVPTLSAVVDTFDGQAAIPPTLIRLKAFFEPWEVTQKETINKMRWRAYEEAYAISAFADTAPPPPPDTEDVDELNGYLQVLHEKVDEPQEVAEEGVCHGPA